MQFFENITVVLANTRFPENVGMAARACANMGVARLALASPERWDAEKALPLATPKGKPVLDRLEVFPSLGEALGGHGLIVGATARTGGWRQAIAGPRAEAAKVVAALRAGTPVALLFGSEDRGLTNEEIMLCHDLVRIPTADGASSLNLAQAVLVLLYECLMAAEEARRGERGGNGRDSFSGASEGAENHRGAAACPEAERDGGLNEPGAAAGEETGLGAQVSHSDYERLMASLKAALLRIDFLHGNNPDYFFMPLRRFFARKGLKRHEYDAFMGICRQITRLKKP